MSAGKEKQEKTLVSHGPASGPCTECGKAGAQACARCRVDFYCGKEHQTQDWLRHKKGCGVFTVRSDATLGRHLVATKDIPAGTIIMRETPLVAVPRHPSPDTPDSMWTVCVGCCRVLPRVRAERCGRCEWPVCGEACGRRDEHKPECAAFQRAGFKLGDAEPHWAALATLRVCLASAEGPHAARLRGLQSALPPLESVFNDARRVRDDPDNAVYFMALMEAHEMFASRCGAAVQWLRERAGVAWLPAEALSRAAAAFFINSLTASTQPGRSASALFAGLSLLEHSCVPSACLEAWGPAGDGDDKDDDGKEGEQQQEQDGDDGHDLEHVLVAARGVARGERLSLSYRRDMFRATLGRRLELARWGFLCRCALCADDQERGLRLGAWHCTACQGAGRQQLVSLANGVRWRCGGCGRAGLVLGGDDDEQDCGQGRVMQLEQRLQAMRASEADLPLEAWEGLVEGALWPRGPLHPTHHVVLQAKVEMVSRLRPADGPAASVDAAHLSGHCRALLAAADALCPGGHLQMRAGTLLRLCLFATTQLSLCATAALMDPEARPQLQPQIESLSKEIAGVVQEMERNAVGPQQRRDAGKMRRGFETLLDSIPPPT